jgi:hypothetical protein
LSAAPTPIEASLSVTADWRSEVIPTAPAAAPLANGPASALPSETAPPARAEMPCAAALAATVNAGSLTSPMTFLNAENPALVLIRPPCIPPMLTFARRASLSTSRSPDTAPAAWVSTASRALPIAPSLSLAPAAATRALPMASAALRPPLPTTTSWLATSPPRLCSTLSCLSAPATAFDVLSNPSDALRPAASTLSRSCAARAAPCVLTRMRSRAAVRT